MSHLTIAEAEVAAPEEQDNTSMLSPPQKQKSPTLIPIHKKASATSKASKASSKSRQHLAKKVGSPKHLSPKHLSEKGSAKSAHKQVIDTKKSAHKKEIDTKKSAHKKEIDTKRSAHTKEIDTKKSALTKEIDTKKSAHTKEIDTNKSSHKKALDIKKSVASNHSHHSHSGAHDKKMKNDDK